ncbi:MAG: hypothetical protein JNL85_16340 [Rubrivivax sp.]|nr:hypothetical protein [Rubrivivax sp.]
MRALYVLLCALCALKLLAACSPEHRDSAAAEDFVERHWAVPLPAQGEVPAGFSALEASLAPEACGQCHAEQWRDWQGSLHARSMGPGLGWQLHLMDQAAANRCLRCHAPLAEQKALLAQEMAWPARPAAPPPAHVPADLAHQGLVCAACHVRGHRRYGPLPGPNRPLAGASAHAGFEAVPAFSDSRFCAPCHQFPDSGPRTAGKLHEDTYRQWQASPQATRQGCQGCHMPGRRHLWRGIHDAAMTRQAIDVVLDVEHRQGRRYAVATVRNVGAGHHFPTYMVPKVELRFAAVDATGTRAPLGTRVIGWTVDTDLQHEIEDTRIPAGAAGRFEAALPEGPERDVELVVVVKPGEHYERTFARSLERERQWPAAAVAPLREALARVRAAEYELLRLRLRRDRRVAN